MSVLLCVFDSPATTTTTSATGPHLNNYLKGK